jgi:hypothetical protein
MAKPEWLNKYLRMKPEVRDIFEDLDNYRKFCIDFGYIFDEDHLYNERNSNYNEYLKFARGREPWDQWRTPKRKEFVPRDRNSNSNWKSRNNA